MICTEKPLKPNKSSLNIAETVKGINCQGSNLNWLYGEASVNPSASKPMQLRQSKKHFEELLQEPQTLKNILIFLCSISPETNLRLVLQLALAAYIPDDQLESLLVQFQSPRSLESLLLDADILTQILEADGQLGAAEENFLLEAMDFTGLIVPSSLSGAQFLLEDLSHNLVQEMHLKEELEGLLQELQTLKNILIFLCAISPETNLRLVLQLALAAYIPDDQLESLLVQLQSPRSLESLLLDADLLTQILEADDQLGAAEENFLLEAIDFTGLVVPSSLSGAQFLLEELAHNLANEISPTI